MLDAKLTAVSEWDSNPFAALQYSTIEITALAMHPATVALLIYRYEFQVLGGIFGFRYGVGTSEADGTSIDESAAG